MSVVDKSVAYLFIVWKHVSETSELLGAQRFAVSAGKVLDDVRGGNSKLSQENVDLKSLLVVKKTDLEGRQNCTSDVMSYQLLSDNWSSMCERKS